MRKWAVCTSIIVHVDCILCELMALLKTRAASEGLPAFKVVLLHFNIFQSSAHSWLRITATVNTVNKLSLYINHYEEPL